MKNIEKYQKLIAKGEVDALLLTSKHNRQYAAEYCIAEGVAVICKTQWPRGRHWLCGLIASWSVAICASTMLVHQHHVLDVVTALMLTAVLYVLIRPLKVPPQPPRI